MNILLNSELEHRITLKVESGLYQSPAEVIQQGIDLLDARDGAAPTPAANNESPIWEDVAALGRNLKPKDWESIPPDLSKNIEHYLYGSPKDAE